MLLEIISDHHFFMIKTLEGKSRQATGENGE
jgi:hypothetical protein